MTRSRKIQSVIMTIRSIRVITLVEATWTFSFDTVKYPKFCLQSSIEFEANQRGSLSLCDWLKWMSQPLVAPGARANHGARNNLKMGQFSQWAKRPAWPISITSLSASFFNLKAALSPTSLLSFLILPFSFSLPFLSPYTFPLVYCLFHICFFCLS